MVLIQSYWVPKYNKIQINKGQGSLTLTPTGMGGNILCEKELLQAAQFGGSSSWTDVEDRKRARQGHVVRDSPPAHSARCPLGG